MILYYIDGTIGIRYSDRNVLLPLSSQPGLHPTRPTPNLQTVVVQTGE